MTPLLPLALRRTPPTVTIEERANQHDSPMDASGTQRVDREIDGANPAHTEGRPSNGCAPEGQSGRFFETGHSPTSRWLLPTDAPNEYPQVLGSRAMITTRV